jgi:hypothetical protein
LYSVICGLKKETYNNYNINDNNNNNNIQHNLYQQNNNYNPYTNGNFNNVNSLKSPMGNFGILFL